MKIHRYTAKLQWEGNLGSGTSAYNQYSRQYTTSTEGKPSIPGSSDPAFRGDASRYNPEELLVHALAACHMLWYLHLCAVNGVTVVNYLDLPEGWMEEDESGSGRFTRVELRPEVLVSDPEMIAKARELHEASHKRCFIANSVNFIVEIKSIIQASPDPRSAHS